MQEAESKDVDSWSEAYAEGGWLRDVQAPDLPSDFNAEEEWYKAAGVLSLKRSI